MSENKVALAVGAHPDDVEFMMAGTLAALGDAGYEPHIFTVGNGNGGTATHTQEEIVRLRGREARNAAAVIGGTYHPGLVNDLEIYYEDELLRRVSAVVREVQPEIVLTHSPQDYMEDHQNTSRLIVTACFSRGMRNWVTVPQRAQTFQDVYLYHCQPYGNRDQLRNPIVPTLFVDVTDKIEVKEEMLRCHATQKQWLDLSQGMDSYLITMRELCAEVGQWAGGGERSASSAGEMAPVKYAEGFRQHLHGGLSAEDADPLTDLLAGRVQKAQ